MFADIERFFSDRYINSKLKEIFKAYNNFEKKYLLIKYIIAILGIKFQKS